jgi:hypothetical protein
MARLVGSAIAWKISLLIARKSKSETEWLQVYAQLFGFASHLLIFFWIRKLTGVSGLAVKSPPQDHLGIS